MPEPKERMDPDEVHVDGYRYHANCLLMPTIEREVFDALVADIKTNGQLAKIVLHPDGSVLDGRHRLAACREAGVEPEFTTWEGADGTELDFVLGENLYRRHLTGGQRAALADDVYQPMTKQEQGVRGGHAKAGTAPPVLGVATTRTRAETAGAFATSESMLGKMRWLRKVAPDLWKPVRAGALNMSKDLEEEARARDNAPPVADIIPDWPVPDPDQDTKALTPKQKGWLWRHAKDAGIGEADQRAKWDRAALERHSREQMVRSFQAQKQREKQEAEGRRQEREKEKRRQEENVDRLKMDDCPVCTAADTKRNEIDLAFTGSPRSSIADLSERHFIETAVLAKHFRKHPVRRPVLAPAPKIDLEPIHADNAAEEITGYLVRAARLVGVIPESQRARVFPDIRHVARSLMEALDAVD